MYYKRKEKEGKAYSVINLSQTTIGIKVYHRLLFGMAEL